ncbi:hypothetical protein H4S02_001555 [Coemansia sp. RSA 2611]|nr:hypothetical protein H4S01_004228 [Coemansia sp. RSA 2610]KAJ2390994.1 hypothetical protein H4S02_001555 [Coemansia sp. RSA 2611]
MQTSAAETASAIYTDVTRENIQPLFSDIAKQISLAEFVAVDTEFTGLGLSNASPVFRFDTADWLTRATDMRDMYKGMANVAKTHALVSMGLSTFVRTSDGMFHVYSFNFILQEQSTHLVSPASIAFLAQNGFDLGKQALQGIRYFSGPNPHPVESRSEDINLEGDLLRKVLFALVRAKKPLVIHNGLFDLVYIYQSFFGPLPDSHESFVFDLHTLFPAGIYDTKLIAESLDPGTASFLAYLYHKSERIHRQRREQAIEALSIKQTKILVREKSGAESDRNPQPRRRPQNTRGGKTPETRPSKPYCEHFAAFGHCKFRDQCRHSHDLEFILDCQQEEAEAPADQDAAIEAPPVQNGKRKRNDEGSLPPSKILKALGKNMSQLKTESSVLPAENSGSAAAYHTAAYDAYMTGFIFASLRLVHGDAVEEHKNKVFRMGRGVEPLLIQASIYASASTTYRQTIKLIEEMEFPGETAKSEPPAN